MWYVLMQVSGCCLDDIEVSEWYGVVLLVCIVGVFVDGIIQLVVSFLYSCGWIVCGVSVGMQIGVDIEVLVFECDLFLLVDFVFML